jgi:hypothetical protein
VVRPDRPTVRPGRRSGRRGSPTHRSANGSACRPRQHGSGPGGSDGARNPATTGAHWCWCRIARPYNHVVVRPIERPISRPYKRQDKRQCSLGCPACSNGRTNGRTKPRLGQSRNGRAGSEPKHVRTRRTSPPCGAGARGSGRGGEGQRARQGGRPARPPHRDAGAARRRPCGATGGRGGQGTSREGRAGEGPGASQGGQG